MWVKRLDGRFKVGGRGTRSGDVIWDGLSRCGRGLWVMQLKIGTMTIQ